MSVGCPSSGGHNKAHIHTIYPNFIEIGSAMREISSVQTDRHTHRPYDNKGHLPEDREPQKE